VERRAKERSNASPKLIAGHQERERQGEAGEKRFYGMKDRSLVGLLDGSRN